MKSRVSVESLILVAICIADMLTTLFLVLRGCAVEQNPLMAACMNHSPVTFVLVKTASFVPFVVAVELYRRKNPDFARMACRCAIVLYVAIFITLTLGTNLT
ncbi:MAG: hypothetical protein A2Z18_08830 [Armatimonadetes bacterium RBG_16_58_9]|nr:MAG: hypothetical protein A2Z18_08830 [Armatimonadetes bacterium RBG_16_58_9]